MMRISIITPSYQAAKHITACVENVSSQGIENLEHLIVDGGSTDGTLSILSELAKRYPHLRVISEKDNGQSDAMNKGVRLASGSIIGCLNVDDFYQPHAILEGLDFLESHPRVDFVTGDCLILKHDGSSFMNRPSDLRLESLLLGWDWAEYPCNSSAYFYRINVHDKVGYFDISEHYAMDLMFILECAAKVRMAYVPRHWGNFCLLPETKTFRDTDAGPARVRAIRNRWLAQLSPIRRIRINLIWQQKRFGKFLFRR